MKFSHTERGTLGPSQDISLKCCCIVVWQTKNAFQCERNPVLNKFPS